MVKAASGFLTKDNRFFPSQEAAELNEAEVELVDIINRDTEWALDADLMLDRIQRHHKAINRYIFAWSRSNDLSTKPSGTSVSPDQARVVRKRANTTITKPPKVVKGDTDNGQTEERVPNV